MRDGIQNYKAQFSSFAQALQVVPQLTAPLNEKRPFRLLSFSGPSCVRWLADGAMLHAMNESFPQWPSLFCYFVLPSGPKHLLLNLWITDSQATTPMEMVEQLDLEYRLILQNMSRTGVWIASGLRQSATRILPPSEGQIASNFCSLIPIRDAPRSHPRRLHAILLGIESSERTEVKVLASFCKCRLGTLLYLSVKQVRWHNVAHRAISRRGGRVFTAVGLPWLGMSGTIQRENASGKPGLAGWQTGLAAA